MWTRILSALILAPLFLLALFRLPATGIVALMGVVLAVALWEAGALIGFPTTLKKWTFLVVVFAAGSGAVFPVMRSQAGDSWIFVLSGLAALWWVFQIFQLSRYTVRSPGMFGTVTGRAVNAGLVILSSWIAIISLYIHDPGYPLLLVYLIVMIWVADSGAYFAGKFLGSHKLATNVSPGKTIEGVVGGIVAVAAYSATYSILVFEFSGWRLVAWMVIALIVTLVSVAGDLNESALKRAAGKKDSGNIIPGHGGVFDRIDAITAAAPVFYFLWQIFSRGFA